MAFVLVTSTLAKLLSTQQSDELGEGETEPVCQSCGAGVRKQRRKTVNRGLTSVTAKPIASVFPWISGNIWRGKETTSPDNASPGHDRISQIGDQRKGDIF